MAEPLEWARGASPGPSAFGKIIGQSAVGFQPRKHDANYVHHGLLKKTITQVSYEWFLHAGLKLNRSSWRRFVAFFLLATQVHVLPIPAKL